VTLPDDKQNYVHRIGRVGRAERMGLAISLASKVQEKVWYHTCQSKGKNCLNTVLKDEGGCCIWYNEMQYLDDIEEHLGVTIAQVPPSLEVPVDEFDGKVTYGEKKKAHDNVFKGHVQTLQPTVTELTRLEKKAQLNFLNLKYNKSLFGL
jgi:ATP-dependent RNA helicase DDX1